MSFSTSYETKASLTKGFKPTNTPWKRDTERKGLFLEPPPTRGYTVPDSNSSEGPSHSQTNAGASSFCPPGLGPQTTVPFFRQHSSSAWTGKEDFLKAPAVCGLRPLPEHEFGLCLGGGGRGGGNRPDPGKYPASSKRESERGKGAGSTQREFGGRTIRHFLWEAESKGREGASLPILTGKLQLLNKGIQGSSQAIVHRLLRGQWLITCHGGELVQKWFNLHMHALGVGSETQDTGLIHSFFPTLSGSTYHALGPVMGTGRCHRESPCSLSTERPAGGLRPARRCLWQEVGC